MSITIDSGAKIQIADTVKTSVKISKENIVDSKTVALTTDKVEVSAKTGVIPTTLKGAGAGLLGGVGVGALYGGVAGMITKSGYNFGALGYGLLLGSSVGAVSGAVTANVTGNKSTAAIVGGTVGGIVTGAVFAGMHLKNGTPQNMVGGFLLGAAAGAIIGISSGIAASTVAEKK